MSQSLSASDAKRAAQNVSALVAASILSNGILFAWTLVLNAWLGPRLVGIQTTVFGLYAILSPLASLGMGLIAIREIAQKPEKIGQYASIMLFTQTALSGTAYLILVLTAYTIGFSNEILAFVAIAGTSFIIDSFGNIANDLLKAQEQMLITSVMEIGQVLFRIGLTAFLLWQGWSLIAVYGASITVSILRSVILWWIHWRHGLKLEWPLQWQSLALPLLLNAWPLAAAAMLSLGYDHADRIILTRFVDETSSGYFSLVFLIHFGVIELLSTTVLVAMYPLLSRYYGKGESFGYLSEALSRFMLMAALPISLMLSIYAAEIIGLVSTKDFAGSIGILQIYTWYTLLTMVGNVFSKALLIQNRQRYLLIVRGVGLGINILLNIILLLRYRDPRMAAIASVAAEAGVLLLLLAAFRAEGFVWRRALSAALRILIVGAMAGLVMVYLGEINWLVGLSLAAMVYLFGLGLARVLSEEDLDLLYRLTAAMPFGTFVQRFWKRKTVINF
jgi:O-antigen/teichoic acid export membrane protein